MCFQPNLGDYFREIRQGIDRSKADTTGACLPLTAEQASLSIGAIPATERPKTCSMNHRWCVDPKACDWMQVGQKLEAVVELDKDDYLVLSFPERAGVIGFAATSDLNLQSQRTFSLGQKLQATVVALPTHSTGAASLLEQCHSSSMHQ